MVTDLGVKGFVINADGGCIVFKAHALSTVLNPDRLSFVFGLLCHSRPPAILGSVIKVVINSLDGSTFWRFPHVFKKSRESRQPSFAHLDAPTAVRRPLRIVGIANALLSMFVRFKGSAGLSSNSVPVGYRSTSDALDTQAPAAFRYTAPDSLQREDGGVSAVTLPEPWRPLSRLSLDCYKSLVSFASNIKGLHATPMFVAPDNLAVFGDM